MWKAIRLQPARGHTVSTIYITFCVCNKHYYYYRNNNHVRGCAQHYDQQQERGLIHDGSSTLTVRQYVNT